MALRSHALPNEPARLPSFADYLKLFFFFPRSLTVYTLSLPIPLSAYSSLAFFPSMPLKLHACIHHPCPQILKSQIQWTKLEHLLYFTSQTHWTLLTISFFLKLFPLPVSPKLTTTFSGFSYLSQASGSSSWDSSSNVGVGKFLVDNTHSHCFICLLLSGDFHIDISSFAVSSVLKPHLSNCVLGIFSW